MKRYFKNITFGEFSKVFLLRAFGNFLILSSLFMIAKTFYQPVREEVRFTLDNLTQKKYVVASTKEAAEVAREPDVPKGLLSELLKTKPYEVLTPEDPNFSILIPKIGANARIITTNAGDEKAYLDTLKKGVGHAEGTAFPGEGENIFLFAHSTDYFWNVGTYNAVFYLLYKLEPEDTVNVFYKGQRFAYKVYEKKIVDPTDVFYLTHKTNKEVLTLQTCWPPGTTLKRMLVFARPVAE